MSQPDFAEGNAARDAADFCYRHPDRQSYILCQRCGRTICPECQTQAAVGFHCPECMRESRASAPRMTPTITRTARRVGRSDGPVVTYALIGITVLAFVSQLIVPLVTLYLSYYPARTTIAPWTMITSIFIHSPTSFLHILFNMFSLFIFGRIIEQGIGRVRFLVLYLVAGFGGSVAVLLLSPDTGAYGASGAIFGLLGAFFVLQRRMGGNNTQLIVLIAINLGIGFIVPGISWQSHVGGLVVGAAVALIYTRTRAVAQRRQQVLLVVGVVIALVALTAVGMVISFA